MSDAITTIMVRNLFENEHFARAVVPHLKDEYFDHAGEQAIIASIRDIFTTHNSLPSVDSVRVGIDAGNLGQQDYNDAVELLDTVSNYNGKWESTEWLVKETEKFCQEKALFKALMEAITIKEGKSKKDKNAIPEVLKDALAVSFETNIGHDYFDSAEQRYDFFHEVHKKIPFRLEMFNKITGGGIRAKTLTVPLAGTNVGKSLFCADWAAFLLENNYNVGYITLEMAEEKVAERIDANLLNMPISEVRDLPKMYFTKLVNKVRERTKTRLKIKEYPTSSAHVGHFRYLLDEWKTKQSFVPDILFVDYINICSSSRFRAAANVNSYTYVKAIAEELRGLAVEKNVPIVTPTQTNREGFSSSDVGLENTAESFGLPATADLMFALLTSEDLEALNQLMVKQLKNRDEDVTQNKRFVIGIDRPKMKLYDVSGGGLYNGTTAPAATPAGGNTAGTGAPSPTVGTQDRFNDIQL